MSNKNVILYYYYLKNLFPHYKEEENPCHSLFKDKQEEKFFLDKDKWCALEDYVNIVEKAIKITNNFELPKIVGSLLAKYQKEYKLQEFKEAVLQSLRGFFFGPLEIFRQISFFNYLFNKTKDMRIVSEKCGDCILLIKFKPGINPVFDFVSEMHIEGIFSSILDLFGMKNGKILTPLKEYDLKLLIEEKFYGIKEKCEERGDLFYLGDEVIAEKADLISETIKNETLYLGKSKPYKQGVGDWGWKISKNVFMEKKYLVLKEGDIYNAPYFITFIKWERDSAPELISKFFSLKVNEFSPLGRGYGKLVQERLAKEQEAAMLMAERQKMEREYHQLLLKNYIHPHFIDRAKIGLIPFKDVWVTNIFLDIHQSTQIRKQVGNGIYRRDRNILLKLIKKNLHEAAGEWGWLNKATGDGCYIVMGAYNYFKDNQDFNHAEAAVNFSVKLMREIEQIKDKNRINPPHERFFADYHIRIGLETGKVEMGEAYEQDIGAADQEVDLGTLRVFDTDGHSVNIAKRIEETAKQIIAKEEREEKGGIFLGPTISNIISGKRDFNDKIRRIDLNKLGVAIKDYRGIKVIGEFII